MRKQEIISLAKELYVHKDLDMSDAFSLAESFQELSEVYLKNSTNGDSNE